MSVPDAKDHALRILLAEQLGGAAPPDLAPGIRAHADSVELTRLSTSLPERAGDPAPRLEPVAANVGEPTVSVHSQRETFAEAMQQDRPGLMREFCGFMSENAKWWLVPFLIVFALLGFALVLGSTGAAPFIYTMF